MSLRMTENDKNTMLDNILPENEVYTAKLWGVIMASPSSMKALSAAGGAAGVVLGSALGGGVAGALGALSNEYCYVGLTDKRIVFNVIEKFDCSKVKTVFDIELSKITKVKFKFGIIPGRKVMVINYDGGSIKLSLVGNAIGTDIKNQKENQEVFVNKINEMYCN